MSYLQKVGSQKVSAQGVYDFQGFLHHLTSWMKRHNYTINEKLHAASTKDAKKSVVIKWSCDTEYDDYHQFLLKVKISASNYTEGLAKGKKVLEGEISVSIDAEVERDYENKWATQGPVKKFLRAFYDSVLAAPKKDTVNSELENHLESFMSEIKRYLNLL